MTARVHVLRELDFAAALELVQEVMREAESLKIPVSVAVVDDARDLLAFGRMPGALLASIETAQSKAYTSMSVNRATREVGRDTQPGGPLWGLETSHARPLVTFGGGQVLRRGELVVGAVGVAGGSPEEDDRIIDAALARWERDGG